MPLKISQLIIDIPKWSKLAHKTTKIFLWSAFGMGVSNEAEIEENDKKSLKVEFDVCLGEINLSPQVSTRLS